MGKYLLHLMVVASTLFLLDSCSGQKVEAKSYDLMLKSMLSHSVNEITVSELDSMMATDTNLVILDTREHAEYKVSHIQNAICVGYDSFELSSVADIPKDKTIVTYCSIGVRSEKVAEQLQDDGYENVSNLYGSIFEWVNQGEPVYDQDGEETSKVHAYDKTWGIWLKKGEKVYE